MELREFAASLARDRAAVEVALHLPWSTGLGEGLITKLKLVKADNVRPRRPPLLRARPVGTA